MDKKDEIIAAQLELIREMTERNIRRISDDIWSSDGSTKRSAAKVGTPVGGATTDNAGIGNGEKAHGDMADRCTERAEGGNDKAKSSADKPAAASASADGDKGESGEAVESIDELLAELDSYIGLERVKKEVRSLINTARVTSLRRERGLPTVDTSLHMVFSGNPGTGKTVIARFMARVYRSLGLLSKGQLVECDRSSLVAGFVGQTSQKTAEVLKSALGGVLFIDEAYSLTSHDGQDFGPEAVDTILKFMEDHRDDLVVIVAGYGEQMEDFIDSNPGLRSRFVRYIDFDDYSAEELTEIFRLNLSRGLYTLGEGAEELLFEYFTSCAADAARFGNARGVRNTFEHALRAQADRLATIDAPSREELTLITREDIAAATALAEEAL